MPEPIDQLQGHFQAILDALSDGVYISDRNGISLCVNKVYEQMTGLHREDIVGQNVVNLVELGVFDTVLNPEIVQTGKPVTRVQHLGDGKTLVLSGYPVFSDTGELALVVTFARDITLLTDQNSRINTQSQLLRKTNRQLAYMAEKQQNETFVPTFASHTMGEVVNLAERIAPTDASVLILGETGVGKDVMARLIHKASNRKDKLMLKVDCGGISETLTESEMFGYVAGAFTGASSKGKAGYFEIADGSTLFLDEVGELPMSMQTRLLRVLQDGEIVRVGSSNPRKVDVRIIAATNKDLAENVKAGTFRSDLYYRLNVASIRIPPLRERSEDLQPLSEMFLASYNAKYHKDLSFMQLTMELMKSYSWPGNVRELQNMIHSIVITTEGPLISPDELPSQVVGKQNGRKRYIDVTDKRHSLKDIMAEVEADFLIRAIDTYGSIQKVTELFNIDRSTIYRKIHRVRKSIKLCD